MDISSKDNSLMVDISSIVKSEGAVLEVKKVFPKAVFEEIDRDFPLDSDVCLDGSITNLSGNLFLKGTVSFSLLFSCDRCLKEFRQDFCISVDEVIAKDNAGFEEDEYIPYSGSKVLLTEGIYKTMYPLVLEKHLCSVDCKGLCASCGCNLNFEECTCKDEEIDPRLEKLREFFKN